MEKTIEERFEEVGYLQSAPMEWQPAILFTDEFVTEDWLGTPIAWTYDNGKGKTVDFETFEETIKFLKEMGSE